MTQTHSPTSTALATTAGTRTPPHAAAIPPLRREEVVPMARLELDRFLALIDTLAAAEWEQPTACALWTVKDIVAHQASHVVQLTSVREMLRQNNPRHLRDYTNRGMNTLDAANQQQVDRRKPWPPAQIVAEIREHSETSFAGRQRFPFLLRAIRIPVPGFAHRISIGYLIDTIFTRDMWMHRLDICRATGRALVQTPVHDGRITALAVRDLDRHLARTLSGRSIIYRLTGPAGGEWTVGSRRPPAASITLDTLDFHELASGRITSHQARDRGLVTLDGDAELGNLALQHTVVLY